MSEPVPPPESPESSELERHAQQAPRSLPVEFFAFLMDNKKWWLAPLILTLLLIGALVVLGGSGAAPFIYTLF